MHVNYKMRRDYFPSTPSCLVRPPAWLCLLQGKDAPIGLGLLKRNSRRKTELGASGIRSDKSRRPASVHEVVFGLTSGFVEICKGFFFVTLGRKHPRQLHLFSSRSPQPPRKTSYVRRDPSTVPTPLHSGPIPDG